MGGLDPESVLSFTPPNANPKYQGVVIIAPVSNIAALKVKTNISPSGTPAREGTNKKQNFKPSAGVKDFTKAGLFHC